MTSGWDRNGSAATQRPSSSGRTTTPNRPLKHTCRAWLGTSSGTTCQGPCSSLRPRQTSSVAWRSGTGGSSGCTSASAAWPQPSSGSCRGQQRSSSAPNRSRWCSTLSRTLICRCLVYGPSQGDAPLTAASPWETLPSTSSRTPPTTDAALTCREAANGNNHCAAVVYSTDRQ